MKDNNNSLAVPNLHIPPEAVEAGAIDLYRSVYPAPQYHSWAETPEWTRKIWREHATAAIRAALAAWPGVEHMAGDEAFPFYYLILPLTEPRE